MTEPSDRELLDRVIADGDELAFRRLYQRHTPALLRMALRLTDNRDGSAEDLVHDAWLRASERWREFRWRATLRTWLGGILVNCVREARRRWANDRTDPFTTDISDAPVDPDQRLDLEAAILELPAGYRAAVVLHDIEGYSHEEIASMLGIEIGTSKSQLSRGRRALRSWLEPRWNAT